MLGTEQAAAEECLAVKQIGETVWILRPAGALESRTVDALRDRFLEAVDAGALHVVIDLSDVEAIGGDGAGTLVVMADLMLGRHGALWLAARWPDRRGHKLRPIAESGPQALLGVTPELDAALGSLWTP
jgi:anti-anti-sigma regulatory factor